MVNRGQAAYSISIDSPKAAAHVGWVLERKGGGSLTRTILRNDDPDALAAHLEPEWDGEIPAFFAYDGAGKLRRGHAGEMTRERRGRLVADLGTAPVKK